MQKKICSVHDQETLAEALASLETRKWLERVPGKSGVQLPAELCVPHVAKFIGCTDSWCKNSRIHSLAAWMETIIYILHGTRLGT